MESVDPLRQLPGGAVDLVPALQALVRKVIESPRSAWGFDFPFALPRAVAALGQSIPTDDFNAGVAAVAACRTAEEFRRRCMSASPGVELRRRTDREAATPFSPYNLRLFKQTFHGIVDVLQPLRGRSEVAVLPVDSLPAPAKPGERLAFNRRATGSVPHVYLMEVCPASVLRALGYPARGYKGASTDRAERRHAILQRLTADRFVRPAPRTLRSRIVEERNGDAIDAVLAAVGAWRGYRSYDHGKLRDVPEYATEGFVYT